MIFSPVRHRSQNTWNTSVCIFIFLLGSIQPLIAQDSSKSQTIQIVSSYRPVLKPSSKLSFSASPVPPSVLGERFSYVLPDQQYKVLMKSVDLQPAAYDADSLIIYNQHFLKVGYGNFQRIFADAGTSWGAGKPMQIQIFAGHHAQKGNLLFQQSSRTYAQANVQYFKKNNIFHLSSDAKQNNYYYYGNDSLNASDRKDSLRITYNQWSLQLGVNNQTPNSYGLTYDPSVRLHLLDAGRSNEINALIRLPITVRINQKSNFTLKAIADVTRFSKKSDTTYQNNIFSVSPSFHFLVKDITVNLGTQFAWDNGMLQVLPQIGMEAFVKSNKAIVIAGVQSGITKNNFQSLIQLNPWIVNIRSQNNTRIDEYFAGLRGTLPFSLSYRISGGYTNFYRQPLFINVPKTSLFSILHEARLQAFHIKGSADWLHSDKISADLGFELYQFAKQKEEEKPWHFIPSQLHMGLRWRPVNNLMLQTKIFAWKGPVVHTGEQNNFKRLPNVLDANFEVDFRVSRLFLLWIQVNNAFNQTYERWNQYPVLGFQIIGGIRLNFEQKK